MPDISPTYSMPSTQDGSVIKAQWTLAGDAIGHAVNACEWADRSVQFAGDWGGGSVTWEGSNDGGANWFPLTDAQSVAIIKNADALECVVELTELARPRAQGVASVQVSLIARR